jgi:hypothetical protein
MKFDLTQFPQRLAVAIPAKAVIHFAHAWEGNVDSRFRGDDGPVICVLNGEKP